MGQRAVEMYCDLKGLQTLGCGLIQTDILVQAEIRDLVILDLSVHGQHGIALIELTYP
jgi:hypothetical protein